ncbi:hypothetical protein Mnod_8498 (plasmid) [Methylobacterium nodulans ORS 2060]|uniref:Uncharacterized protein n=1 Tax=Methylobacterium nodulans (strain LMG 21967 / CNCM I-2342 / ORS 2060) TaxID=460265 RepID=B8IW10_METNO|nr:hypothetical protein Mnod_8498 [Methylobacterium nodulans ORS 2060]
MAAPVPLRWDFDAEALRRLARASHDPAQTRRLLALSAIYAGSSRSQAAALGGIWLQPARSSCNPGRGARRNASGPARRMDGAMTQRPAKLRTGTSITVAAYG